MAGSVSQSQSLQALSDYARDQKTTGLLVIRGGKTLVEHNWPVPPEAAAFLAGMTYGSASDGALLEDVASQQKSFVAVLAAIAEDRGLLDISRPVSAYLGKGWSKAPASHEDRIAVGNLLTMDTGLGFDFAAVAEPGQAFLYNTPVYAALKPVLEAAAGAALDDITRDWLTAPLGMTDSGWRLRPASMGDSGNPTGLVATPRDVARFGQMVLDRGVAENGSRVVSEAALNRLFERSAANPAYARLWWLNDGAYVISPFGDRREGPMIPAAPSDLKSALGALDRKLYVVPSLDLVAVRMGQSATDLDFDQQFWSRLSAALAAD